MSKKLKKHFFHSLYLFGYENFLCFSDIQVVESMDTYPFPGEFAMGPWPVSTYGPPPALYADFPLLNRVPYAFKCGGRKQNSKKQGADTQGKFVEFNDQDPMTLRGYCPANGQNYRGPRYPYIAGSIGGVSGRGGFQKPKTFIKNYITIPRKDLAKFYSFIEKSFIKSQKMKHDFEVSSRISVDGVWDGSFSAPCSKGSGGGKYLDCTCPTKGTFGECSEFCLECRVPDGVDENGSRKFKTTYTKLNNCGEAIKGYEKKDVKFAKQCGSPGSRWHLCITSREKCSYSGEFKLKGSVELDTGEYYSKLDSNFKKIVNAGSGGTRVLWMKQKIKTDKIEPAEINKDVLTRSSYATVDYTGPKKNDPRYFIDKWKFNVIRTEIKYDYRSGKEQKLFKYLYSNTQDPIILDDTYKALTISALVDIDGPPSRPTQKIPDCQSKNKNEFWYSNTNTKISSSSFGKINIETTSRKNSDASEFRYYFNFNLEGIVYLKQKKEYVLFFHLIAQLQGDSFDQFRYLTGRKSLGRIASRSCFQKQECPREGSGGVTPPLGFFSGGTSKCAKPRECWTNGSQVYEIDDEHYDFARLHLEHNHLKKMPSDEERAKTMYGFEKTMFVKSYRDLLQKTRPKGSTRDEYFINDASFNNDPNATPLDFDTPESKIIKIPITLKGNADKKFEIEAAIPKKTDIKAAVTKRGVFQSNQQIVGTSNTVKSDFFDPSLGSKSDKKDSFGLPINCGDACYGCQSIKNGLFSLQMDKKIEIEIDGWKFSDYQSNVKWEKNMFTLD